MLQHFTSAFPEILKDKRQEIDYQGEAYVSDYTVQGNMAVIIYKEYDDMAMKDRLEFIKDQLGLISVSVIDNNGNFLGTTDTELKSLLLKEDIQYYLDNKDEQCTFTNSVIEKLPDKEKSVIECKSVQTAGAENLLIECDAASQYGKHRIYQ